MYKQGFYEIAENELIAPSVYRMKLKGETKYIERPGQFVDIKIDELYLRRPISVCDVEDGGIVIIYKVVGRGTERLAAKEKGAALDILTGLGNGFDASLSGERPLLIGGGVGVPPLYYLAKKLLGEGKEVGVLLGFNRKEEVILADEFLSLGCRVEVMTADGSRGTKGLVTDALGMFDYSYHYACGPIPMLRAVAEKTAGEGQYSFEARMGCGFGACVGCTVKTKNGNVRICKDGPVLYKEEIIW